MIMTNKEEKSKKVRKHHRTASQIEEEQTRSLYVRLPHTIKNEKEVKELFFGEFKIKLPRQSGRYCHVIFPTVDDKVKNLKDLKNKLVNGKPVFASPPKPINLDKKKKPKQKKIKIPEPLDIPKVGKYLFVSKLEPGTKASEIKAAFPGATTVALLKGLKFNKRQAKVKMSTSQLCLHYANNKSEWPIIKGTKCEVKLARNEKKLKNKKSKSSKTSKSLKIYNGKEQKEDLETTEVQEKEEEESVQNNGSDVTESEVEENLAEGEKA